MVIRASLAKGLLDFIGLSTQNLIWNAIINNRTFTSSKEELMKTLQ